MGCQTRIVVENSLTFAICTHDPDTGELIDTDFAPAYRVYEDETAVPVRTGAMVKLDDVNTIGFYTERIACNSASGFEDRKTYTIYIEATVDGVTGGISYAFVVMAALPGPPAPEECDVKCATGLYEEPRRPSDTGRRGISIAIWDKH